MHTARPASGFTMPPQKTKSALRGIAPASCDAIAGEIDTRSSGGRA